METDMGFGILSAVFGDMTAEDVRAMKETENPRVFTAFLYQLMSERPSDFVWLEDANRTIH